MNINDHILYLFENDDEDDEENKKSKFGKILKGVALAGVGGAAIASQLPAGKAIINGTRAAYHSWRAKANFDSGNGVAAIRHLSKVPNLTMNAAYNYTKSPTLLNLTKSFIKQPT